MVNISERIPCYSARVYTWLIYPSLLNFGTQIKETAISYLYYKYLTWKC